MMNGTRTMRSSVMRVRTAEPRSRRWLMILCCLADPPHTPSALSARCCLRAETIGAGEHLDRVDDLQPRRMPDLPPACLAVARHEVGRRLPEQLEERLADRHGDVVLLLLEAVGPGRPAAGRLDVL